MGDPVAPRLGDDPGENPSGYPETGPLPLLHRLAGPLILYHALILFGAFLLIAGASWGDWRAVGAVLVAAGISIEVTILAWSASLSRSAATRRGPADKTPSGEPPAKARRICVACGSEGIEELPTCPRCGRTVVSLGRLD